MSLRKPVDQYWQRIVLVLVTGLACGGLAAAEASDVVENEPAQAQESAERLPIGPPGVIRLDETVISGNQELPKVLYILPWRDPQGLPEIELSAEFTQTEVFRRLYPPAYRRELSYFETLEGLAEDNIRHQEE